MVERGGIHDRMPHAMLETTDPQRKTTCHARAETPKFFSEAAPKMPETHPHLRLVMKPSRSPRYSHNPDGALGVNITALSRLQRSCDGPMKEWVPPSLGYFRRGGGRTLRRMVLAGLEPELIAFPAKRVDWLGCLEMCEMRNVR